MCFQYLLGHRQCLHAKFWGDKQRALWYVGIFCSGQFLYLTLRSYSFSMQGVRGREGGGGTRIYINHHLVLIGYFTKHHDILK